jgi:phosphohistidine phosphatase
VAAELESPPKEELESAIYDNEVEGLLELVRATPDDIGSLLIVGHNPSIEELAGQLDDAGGDPVIRHRMADGFPTSGYAVLTTSDSWRAVGPGTLRLESFVTPRG